MIGTVTPPCHQCEAFPLETDVDYSVMIVPFLLLFCDCWLSLPACKVFHFDLFVHSDELDPLRSKSEGVSIHQLQHDVSKKSPSSLCLDILTERSNEESPTKMTRMSLEV
jgi:hypothetical protein